MRRTVLKGSTIDTRPVAYMMVGPPGSGKSHWVFPLLSKGFSLISSDQYIEQIAADLGKTYGEVFHQYVGIATSQMEQQLKYLTSANQNLVWDQTNCSVKSRKKKVDRLLKEGYKVIAVTFEISAEELKRRRKDRQIETGKTVSYAILESMEKSYVRPTLAEGFAKIILVTDTDEIVIDEVK